MVTYLRGKITVFSSMLKVIGYFLFKIKKKNFLYGKILDKSNI